MTTRQFLENDQLRLEFESRGAQLVRIYDKEKQQEVLWEGDPAFWGYHAPVLFPFVGKMNGGVYRYQGKQYEIGQHGFARTTDFRLTGKTDTSITYELTESDESMKIYPFAFRFTIIQELKGREISISWHVENPSADEDLWFSVGAHPAFRVPARVGEKKSDYWLSFDGLNNIPYITPDLATGTAAVAKPQVLETEDGYVRLKDHLFDIDTFIFRDYALKQVSLCYPDRSPYVSIRCEGFPFFGIWSKSDAAPFVCLEPWHGCADDTGFTGDLTEKTGIRSLRPNETFETTYQIVIH